MHGSDGTGGPPPGPRYREYLADHRVTSAPGPSLDPFSTPADAEPEPGPWFYADHEGNCSACDEYHIEEGDLIRADGYGGYESEDCASA